MANGTIAFDTLSTSGQITGTAKSLDTDYVVSGTAKAWANFNSTGTLSIRASVNIASITDNNVGHYTANFTNSMSDADYTPNGSGQNSANTAIGLTFNPNTLAASTLEMNFRNESAESRDGAITTITTNGDLA